MIFASKLLVIGLIVGAGLSTAASLDILLGGGRLLDAATGRAGLREACLPELKKVLVRRGFTPDDIEFGMRPGLGANFKAIRTFRSDFTFEDGPEATRIDGIMACVVGKDEVRVEFRTAARPVRTG